MTTPLKQVIQAIEEANEVFTSFWDTKTGKTVYLADSLMTDMTEEEKALAAGALRRTQGQICSVFQTGRHYQICL
ncbi:hypothetical protein [Yeguia hominis]|uniref:Uncharacterized protein n=1 Tax=Yeguia hominis TaxID=2763662 RepID=A0A926D8N7_9FIRM|nr:hypothetical protein [Yeguia hominis]MBC8533407.1 hypothetical protein [Yeguia hominis]